MNQERPSRSTVTTHKFTLSCILVSPLLITNFTNWNLKYWIWNKPLDTFSSTEAYHCKKSTTRSSRPEMFRVKDVLKICNKFTEEHLRQNVTSIKLQSNFIEKTFQHGCSPVNMLHIFRTSFPKNTSGRLLLPYNDFYIIPRSDICSSSWWLVFLSLIIFFITKILQFNISIMLWSFLYTIISLWSTLFLLQ